MITLQLSCIISSSGFEQSKKRARERTEHKGKRGLSYRKVGGGWGGGEGGCVEKHPKKKKRWGRGGGGKQGGGGVG